MLERLAAVQSILSFSLINIKFLSLWSTGQCSVRAWLSRPGSVLLWRPLSSPYTHADRQSGFPNQTLPINTSTEVPPAACSPPAEPSAPGGWTRYGLHNEQPHYCHQGWGPPSGRRSEGWWIPVLHRTWTQTSPGPSSPWPPASLPEDTSSLM